MSGTTTSDLSASSFSTRAVEQGAKHTPGPWEYVPSTEHHGPYVTSQYGSDVCDCYTMSNLSDASVLNGGTSKPIHFLGEMADANARLIAASPDMLAALKMVRELDDAYGIEFSEQQRDQLHDAIRKAEAQ